MAKELCVAWTPPGPFNAALRLELRHLSRGEAGAFYEHKEAPAVLEELLRVAGAA